MTGLFYNSMNIGSLLDQCDHFFRYRSGVIPKTEYFFNPPPPPHQSIIFIKIQFPEYITGEEGLQFLHDPPISWRETLHQGMKDLHAFGGEIRKGLTFFFRFGLDDVPVHS